MEYSIQELSYLSGVTTRTLRWYDQIGLLKPSRVAESGYRYYSRVEVDRLQDILYYRALGVGLAQIKECLDDPSFDRLAALKRHLVTLEAEQQRLEQLIQSVRDTIGAEERKETMSDEKKFEAFKKQVIEQNEKTYGSEVRAKYGDTQVDEANAAVMNLTLEQYQEWSNLSREIQERLEDAVQAGVPRNARKERKLPRSTAGGLPSPVLGTIQPNTEGLQSCISQMNDSPITMTNGFLVAPAFYGMQWHIG